MFNRDGWTVFRSNLGTGGTEVFDAELWAIGVALRKSVSRAEALRAHGVTTVAVFSDSQVAIRRTAAKAKWEADNCTKHYGYRLKGKAGSKRPVPMTSVKPLAARFYRLKSGHAPTGPYVKRFRYREDDMCWWCGGGAVQTREHLFRHCSRWKDQ
jgi:hypothetical protein